MRLTVDGMHSIVEHPRTIPLTTTGDVRRFELPADELEVTLAGRVQGMPLTVMVPNVTPLTGVVTSLRDGGHVLALAPFALEHRDGYGTWRMHVALGDLVTVEHAPRASFTRREAGQATVFDASASFDPDGDALELEWLVGGEVVGDGPVLIRASRSSLPPTLRVTDGSGRRTRVNDVIADAG